MKAIFHAFFDFGVLGQFISEGEKKAMSRFQVKLGRHWQDYEFLGALGLHRNE